MFLKDHSGCPVANVRKNLGKEAGKTMMKLLHCSGQDANGLGSSIKILKSDQS